MAFVGAARSGDLHVLMSLLAAEARLVTDGGGKVQAALNVIDGADRVARFIIGVSAKGFARMCRCRRICGSDSARSTSAISHAASGRVRRGR